MPQPFGDRLAKAVQDKGNAVCVGLDPRLEQLPKGLQVAKNASLEAQANAYERFCCEVIDATHALVPVVKPQSAFFEELGPFGVLALGKVFQPLFQPSECHRLRKRYQYLWWVDPIIYLGHIRPQQMLERPFLWRTGQLFLKPFARRVVC